MAPEEFEADRRRLPRVAADPGMECRLEVKTRVRLLDISLSGALLASEAALPVGTYAHIRAGVGNAPFAPEVQVRRTVDRQREQSGLGAVFIGMDDRSRQSLETFLRKASE
jgi:c-di-GMP-binding flagellar brake protein YcgR